MEPKVSLQTAILCTKCGTVLNNTDDIFGTSCGHLYHFLCLRQCLEKSTNCSHCKSYKPCMFKMFLEFGESPVSWDNQKKTIDLLNVLQDSNDKLANTEEKYKISQDSVQKLENKLKKVNDALNNSQIIISDLEERKSSLEIRNDFLSKDIKLMAKSLDNGSKTVKSNESYSSNSNKKLEHLSDHNGEEIGKKDQLKETKQTSIIKLIDIQKNPPDYENNNYQGKIYTSKESNGTIEESISNIVKSKVGRGFDSKKIQNPSENTENSNKNENNSEHALVCNKESTADSNCVVIHNYSVEYLNKFPAENTVHYLAQKMRISQPYGITGVDMQVNLKYVSLIVKFENKRYKNQFLSNKNRLKKFPNTKYLSVTVLK